ncbi:unnamed protein product [Rotaria magnacalcarata]|uniref:Uncharacterized protein n=1 Tax=Rotaria magnacalcarata TaxID=392030 RepID=A0A815E5C9_9BILA|nr:unnamed protein product [Rotaria magnacalcarata]CAF1305481.1 unnamed protein product [Rotaria magnacalcarata]CAF2246077.1 unnamed protein product [Rotaria magnacalcarata]CAF3957579.1 unnamed protein product [Rotaria magnacalcarata]CAF4029009.1 unnamed protein product [Rotaria magnacalcarata]
MLPALRYRTSVTRVINQLLAARRQQDAFRVPAKNSSAVTVLTDEERAHQLKIWPGIPEHIRPAHIDYCPIDPIEYDKVTSRFAPQVNMWKWVSLLIAIPAVALLTYMNLILPQDHIRPEFKDWDHLRPRMKWPFKDGVHSPFHSKWFTAIHFDGKGYETTDAEFSHEFHHGHGDKH